MNYIAPVAAVLFVATALAACSSAEPPANVVPVVMQDSAYSPAAVTLKKGETVRLDLQNSATQMHDFTVEKIAADRVRTHGGTSGGHDMHGMKYAMHLAVDGGKSGQIDFRPTEAGDYEYFCTVTGHRDAGMRGTIHVQ